MSSKSPTKRPAKGKLQRQQSNATNQSEANQSILYKASDRHASKLTEKAVEISHLQEEVDLRQAKIDVNEDLVRQNEELKLELQGALETNDALQKLNDHQQVTIKDQNKHMEEQQAHLLEREEHISKQQKHISQLVEQIEEQSTFIKRLQAEKSELHTVTSSLHIDKETLHTDLIQASDYMKSLEDKVYTANKTSLDLLKQIRGEEEEIAHLKTYIIDLKSRLAIYLPVKDDQVDVKLAEYINNYPDRMKLKILFMRESSGVYEFGTKRVQVEVMQNKIKIRVGGGNMSIDEFIDQYTPVELEKQQRRDPLTKFAEKVAIQKAVEGHSV